MKEQKEYIIQRFSEASFSLTDVQAEQFLEYYRRLIETNRVMNLTAITEFEDVVEKHFLDSVLAARYFDFSSAQSLIDVGTGAGFPGIPLKILYPQLQVVLLDSLRKRVDFLQGIVDNLKLSSVEAVHGRAEELGRDARFRESFDVCVSRAVANLSTLSEYCTPFLKTGGVFISYKSGTADGEAEKAAGAIKKLGCRRMKTEKYSLGEAGRSLIFMERAERLGSQYPRKAGIPAKKPLE